MWAQPLQLFQGSGMSASQ